MRPARTVASQYWSLDEYVYSIVEPADVVAVSEAAYDSNFTNVAQWAEAFQPARATDPEVILKLNPDLLFVSSSARADFTQLLRAAGIRVFRTYTDFTTLDEVGRTVLLIGYVTGRDTEAGGVYENFRRAVDRARNRKPPGLPGPRVLGYSAGYSYGDQTLFDDVVKTLGAVNVGAENGLRSYAPLNTEQILHWNPEWIVSSAAPGQSEAVRKKLISDPAIALTTAAQKEQIVVFDNNVFLPMSPYTTLLLDALGDALYR
jgi:iron complex transport system substrate-binding protein